MIPDELTEEDERKRIEEGGPVPGASGATDVDQDGDDEPETDPNEGGEEEAAA